MEGEAGAAVLKVLVQNLIGLSKKEILLIRGLDKEAEKLTGILDTIQTFLNDAEMRTIPGDAVKSWLKKLENAAFDADNVLDELKYYVLSDQIKKIKPMKMIRVLSCFCSSFNRHIARPRKMALEIEKTIESLDSIKNEATGLGLKEEVAAHAPTMLDAAYETDSFTDVPIFVGRDAVVSDIVEMLTNSIISNERKISILSIWGMGGLGKTTLTRKVFHHPKVETLFQLRIWVHVSKTFDPVSLFKKILKELRSDHQGESRQEILLKLEEALKDKTYILILDNVWNQDLQEWEDFFDSLLGVTSIKGSAIVVTTRNSEVASIVNPIHIHQLEGLSKEDCWSIIEAKVFGKGDVPLELETVGRKIATRCLGMPLAAKVVGGVLLRNKSEEKWVSIEQKWLPHDEGKNITKILKLSYDSLPSPSLKKCFAYCSIFSNARKFYGDRLIEQWMAEGFLQPDGSNDMKSVGENFIKILLQNSLLQIAERAYDGRVLQYNMHDLVHELARSVSGLLDGSRRVRYMAVEDESSPIPIEVAKYVRSLLFVGKVHGGMFSDFVSLHGLTLEHRGDWEFPTSIRTLIHLRNLDISKTDISELPEWIDELCHLETLRAESVFMQVLPSTLTNLNNLRNLYTPCTLQLPPGIGRLTSLRTISEFPLGNSCKIKELGSLNDLQWKLSISNLQWVHDKEEAEKAYLHQKSKISELYLSWDTYRESETISDEDVTISDEDVLEGLEPHSDLKELMIYGFQGKRFPSWLGVRHVSTGSSAGLDKLVEISLLACYRCEEIPAMGHMPMLKSLYLSKLPNVRFISSSFYGLVNKGTRVAFPSLERLELIKMSYLYEWAAIELAEGTESEVKVFPRLRHLEIKECTQLMSVPTHLSSSSCLQHLKIKSCGLNSLPGSIFTNNPNLSELIIKKCPNLRELPQGFARLGSLEKLIISNCPYLERAAEEDPNSLGTMASCSFVEDMKK